MPIIALLIIVFVYFYIPRWLQVVVFLINFFIPDPIPYLDETIMALGFISKFRKTRKFLKIKNK